MTILAGWTDISRGQVECLFAFSMRPDFRQKDEGGKVVASILPAQKKYFDPDVVVPAVVIAASALRRISLAFCSPEVAVRLLAT